MRKAGLVLAKRVVYGKERKQAKVRSGIGKERKGGRIGEARADFGRKNEYGERKRLFGGR